MNLVNFESLPEGWAIANTCDVCEILAGGPAPQGEEYFLGGNLPFVRVQDMGRLGDEVYLRHTADLINERATRKLRLFPEGSVLFTKSGASTLNNQRAILGQDSYVVSHIGVLIPSPMISNKWIYFLFKGVDFKKLAHSTVMPSLPLSKINNLEIPIPPVNEQHRIIAKVEALFSELDKGIENFKTAREQLKIYRQALLKHAFSGKLTEQWRTENVDKLESAETLLQRIQTERQQRYQQQLEDWEASGKPSSKPKAPKTLPPLSAEELAELPGLPDDWFYVRAEEISDFITKGTTPSKELLFDGSGEIPFIKVYNLTKTGFLDFRIDPTFVSSETHNGFIARSKVYPGDVLMNIVGPPLGKVSIVPSTYPEWNINQAIAIFRSDLISNRFLSAYLAHDLTVRSMMRKSKATAGQFNLTLEICRETLIPFCSQKEQKEIELLIEAKLSEVDQLDQTITTALQQAEALRQSILKKAFSGQLVPQDPNDEPASVLLERINTERVQCDNKSPSNKVKRKKNDY